MRVAENGSTGIGNGPLMLKYSNPLHPVQHNRRWPAGDVPGPPIDIDAQFQPHRRASLLAGVVLHVSDRLQLHMLRRRAPTSSRMRCLIGPAAAGSMAAAGQAPQSNKPSRLSGMKRVLAA